MRAKGDPSLETIPGTVFNSRQVRLLKIVVMAMGLLLVAGFALIIATIAYQAINAREGTADNQSSSTGMMHTLSIGDAAAVSGIVLDGDRMAIHIKKPDHSEIVIMDIGTGRVISRVRLTGD